MTRHQSDFRPPPLPPSPPKGGEGRGEGRLFLGRLRLLVRTKSHAGHKVLHHVRPKPSRWDARYKPGVE